MQEKGGGALGGALGSAERLYIRAELVISLCTEEGMLNATEKCCMQSI